MSNAIIGFTRLAAKAIVLPIEYGVGLTSESWKMIEDSTDPKVRAFVDKDFTSHRKEFRGYGKADARVTAKEVGKVATSVLEGGREFFGLDEEPTKQETTSFMQRR